MALMKTEWIPDEKCYSGKSTSTEIDDDADVYEMFVAWKEFMSFIGYSMESFNITNESKNLEV